AAGFTLFITARGREALESLKVELRCQGSVFDLTEARAVEELFSQALENLGRVDVLINNAGFNKSKDPITSVNAADLDPSCAVDVRALILLARGALKQMGPRRSGHIVNVISSIVHVRSENYSVYSAMKSALHAFTGCLIKEARPEGVKVTGVFP